jgi:Glycosyl-4,4'-diaponeurosporenoate acyltransferase
MSNATSLAVDTRNSAARISDLYLGAIIVINCAFCLTPIELFLIEIWPRHGFSSLLLFVAPLVVGSVVARLLPERYFRVRKLEASGRLYEWVGIRFFKRLVPNGVCINQLMRRSDPNYRLIYDRSSMIDFEASTRFAERCHVVSLFLILPCTVYALNLGWYKFALWLVLPNIPLHVYPILLQRYTRSRIDRVLLAKRRIKVNKSGHLT